MLAKLLKTKYDDFEFFVMCVTLRPRHSQCYNLHLISEGEK